jgi:hypothetical protein
MRPGCAPKRMSTSIFARIIVLVLCALGSSASALTITQFLPVNAHVADGATFSGEFNLAPWFNPSSELVTSGSLKFILQEDGGDAVEKFNASVGGISVQSDGQVGGNGAFSPFTFVLLPNMLHQLQALGKLSFALTAVDLNRQVNDFLFASAELTLNIENLSGNDQQLAKVRDSGATGILLGIALAFVFGFHHLRRSWR